MGSGKRLVEIMTDLLIKFEEFIDGQKLTNHRLENVESGIGKVKNEIVKLNLHTAENTRAIIKLADKIDTIAD